LKHTGEKIREEEGKKKEQRGVEGVDIEENLGSLPRRQLASSKDAERVWSWQRRGIIMIQDESSQSLQHEMAASSTPQQDESRGLNEA
jgi:hypothetical protein